MSVQEVVDAANASIGVDYCADVCQARCCRSGNIYFDPKYIDLITLGHPELVRVNQGVVWLSIKHGCPSLSDDNRCMIYDEKGRPDCCRDMPLKYRERGEERFLKIHLCPAVEDGILNEHLKAVLQIAEAEGVEILRYPERASENLNLPEPLVEFLEHFR